MEVDAVIIVVPTDLAVITPPEHSAISGFELFQVMASSEALVGYTLTPSVKESPAYIERVILERDIAVGITVSPSVSESPGFSGSFTVGSPGFDSASPQDTNIEVAHSMSAIIKSKSFFMIFAFLKSLYRSVGYDQHKIIHI